MNPTLIFFAIVFVLVAVFYTHVAFSNLYTTYGLRRDLQQVPKWKWAAFLIPTALIILGIPGITTWDNPLTVTTNIICISVVIAVVIEIIRWWKAKHGLDITLEECFRMMWKGIEVLDPKTVSLNADEADFQRRVQKNPQKNSMAMFRLRGTSLRAVLLVYLDYLVSIGHKEVDWKEKEMFERIAARAAKPTWFLLTASEDGIAMLHHVMYDPEPGIITVLSDIKNVVVK